MSTRSSRRAGPNSAARSSSNIWSSCGSPSACASASRRGSPSTWRGSPEDDDVMEITPMRILGRVAWSSAVMVLALLGAAVSESWGQHGHGHAGGHQAAEACSAEFDKVVGEGRGFGLAFAADQNGYPGPLHVLELKDQLKLTADQEAKAQALLHAMFAESKPKSARLLEAEAKLRRLFADRAADDAAVRAAVAEVERARSEVRLVHLLAHLKTRDLLTEDQRRIYHAARWSGR